MTGITRPGAAALALLGCVAVTVAGTMPRTHTQMPAAAAQSHLVVYGGHGPASTVAPRGKLDGALADLVRHAAGLRPGSKLSDLRALNPAARFQVTATSGPMVAVDAITRGDPQKLKAALVASGLQHPSVYLNDVSGWLPLTQIAAAAARTEVHALRAALPRTRTGAVTSTGDYVQGSAGLRASWPTVDGTGVTVGILSDSYDCYATYAAGTAVPASGPNGYASNGFTADAAKDISTGDLPAQVSVLAEAGQFSAAGLCMDFGAPMLLPYGDEGRAMLQVVHDVAPGASLAFHTATEGEADFATGIAALAAAGAKVIGDDVGYFDEPFFQPSLVGQEIDAVHAQGVAYFVAAGNDGQLSYDNKTPVFTPTTTGEMALNFDTTGTSPTSTLQVQIAPQIGGGAGGLMPGEFVAVVLEWDQPYVTGAPGSPGASSQLDLCIGGGIGGDIIVDLDGNQVSCTGPNALGVDPVQILLIGNPANAAGNTQSETVGITVGLVDGSPPPGRIKIAVLDNGAGSNFANLSVTPGSTVQGHAGADGAISLGAAFWATTPLCGTDPAQVETFSSAGGDPILFDKDGNPLAIPLTPQKPDLVAPDGGNNTFLGFTIMGNQVQGFPQCTNDPNLPSFFGTSAATPHAAGVAALMLQTSPAITADEIYSALKNSAAVMTGSPSNQVGAGFIQAEAALALLPPGTPTLTLSATSITAGQSATITWSSVNTTGCTASGSWSGAQTSSGTMTVTPAAGNYTYTLTCANSAATSKAASASLAVQAPSGGGGGGGALEILTLLLLGALASWRAAGLPLRTSARRVH